MFPQFKGGKPDKGTRARQTSFISLASERLREGDAGNKQETNKKEKKRGVGGRGREREGGRESVEEKGREGVRKGRQREREEGRDRKTDRQRDRGRERERDREEKEKEENSW